MSSAIRFTVNRYADRAVVGVGGEIDLSSAAAFRDGLANLVREGVRNIDLGLDDVTFIDSSGLHTLLRLHTVLGESGNVRVIAMSDAVRRMLDLTGVTRYFEGPPVH